MSLAQTLLACVRAVSILQLQLPFTHQLLAAVSTAVERGGGGRIRVLTAVHHFLEG
jgi:hypothetical protein